MPTPTIPLPHQESSDQYFITEFSKLHRRIIELVTLGYDWNNHADISSQEVRFCKVTDGKVNPLHYIYSREILARAAMWTHTYPFVLRHSRTDPPKPNNDFKRTDYIVDSTWFFQGDPATYPNENCMRVLFLSGLVWRVLHDEFFDGLREFLQIKLPDPTETWKYKSQKVGPFVGLESTQVKERANDATTWRDRTIKKLEQSRKVYDGELGAGGVRVTGHAHFKKRKYQHVDWDAVERTELEILNPPKKPRLRFFEGMEEIKGDGIDLFAINAARAEMFKVLFTSQGDPLYEVCRELRARVVNLIMDILEPFRKPRYGSSSNRATEPVDNNDTASTTEDTSTNTTNNASPHLPRKAIKTAFWSIVKSAFQLAVTMRCQRSVIMTFMHRPSSGDFDFNPLTMWNLTGPNPDADGKWSNEKIGEICSIARKLGGPGDFYMAGRVLASFMPGLVRRGDGKTTNYSEEKWLIKEGVIAMIPSTEDQIECALRDLKGLLEGTTRNEVTSTLEAQRIERNYWANIEAEKALERGANNYERYGDIGQSNTTWEQGCAQDLEDLKRENIAPLFKELTDAAAKEAEEKKRKMEGKGERGKRGFLPDEMAPVEDELDPKNFPPRMGRKNVERPLQKLPVVRQKEAKR